MDNRFGVGAYVNDELHYSGESNNRPIYQSFKYPGNELFYDETYNGWIYSLGHQIMLIGEDGTVKPYAGYRTSSTCPPEREQHWIDGSSADNDDFVIVKVGLHALECKGL